MRFRRLAIASKQLKGTSMKPDDILNEMANTFKERNGIYRENWHMVGKVMEALHPDGLHLLTAQDHERFHLYCILVVKLTRFAISGSTHIDSIHDIGVYAAMIEHLITTNNHGEFYDSGKNGMGLD